MKIEFLYGKDGLLLEFPDDYNITVMEPDEEPPISEPVDAIYNSFFKPMSSKPLKTLLERRAQGEIVIVIEDHTRPMPSKPVLNALIRLFEELNIEDNQVKILVGTGLHRAPNPEELERMVGSNIINRFDIIFHNANDDMSLEHIGENSYGNSVYLNSRYVNAAFKIITGYVEPHFFAGFSGGRKALVPGIAGKSTILHNHSAKNIDSDAHFGKLDSNPIHKDALEISKMPTAKPDFCINVTLNSKHEITKIGTGSMNSVHNYLVDCQKKACFKKINSRYDIVICGNGGYPLDMNLYQAVKSMAIGEMAAKTGGIIISVNECSDKVGQEKFEELINCGKSPKEIYQAALNGDIKIPDIWEIQIMARVLMNYSVYVVSNMSERELGNVGLKYASGVTDAVNKASLDLNIPSNEAKILVLPKGPLVLPEYTDS